eukprot:Blabericola_migrator_1__1830@NODE_1499_length_4405_cov_78_417012_g480_i1_p1_GENE_NODE_1499_length_4405_cov_78_417012_g480_i1NODE_1499_length_4405_cov_78_417012_g480_i1_p1_ORF_typecomplete_len472_score38_39DUF2530/PF10745_9/0_41DUF2530/PF10745_9/1_6e03NnrU/PF07298_11/0_65NnrU/PF07298_11/2_5e02_NODE_1499_length_4405_cov_78_417012_g480_i14941909
MIKGKSENHLRQAFRIPGVEGFRFTAHVWVLAFHCLPHMEAVDRLKRNGDSGIFFLLTGMATEIALELHYRRQGVTHDISLFQRIKDFSLYWFKRRIMKILFLSIIAAIVSYYIFPIPGGEGRRIFPYIVTMTVCFLERFDRDRIVWNPNPIIWFSSQLLVFWLLHPLMLRPILRKVTSASAVQKNPQRIFEVGCLLYLILLVTAFLIEPYAAQHTGWSFHPLPRLLQYVCGCYVATVVICAKTTESDNGWLICDTASLHGLKVQATSKTWSKCLYWLLILSPDITYSLQLVYWGFGPERYSTEWKRQWVWKTLGTTPLQMMCLLAFSLQRDLQRGPPLLAQPGARRWASRTGYMRVPLNSTSPASVSTASSHTHLDVSDQIPKVRIGWRDFVETVWSAFWSKSPLHRLFSQKWTERVAPGMVNFLVFLTHFPLSWQLDRNAVTQGRFPVLYCVSLWLLCVTLNSPIQRVC